MSSRFSNLKEKFLWKGRRVFLAKPARSLPPSASPLIVAGLFGTASGIGQSARACAEALDKHGMANVRIDLSERFNQLDLPQGNCAPIPSGNQGTIILHLNAPETSVGLFALRHFRPKKWRVIGYWAWELERLPPSWRHAQTYLTEIWTPSDFTSSAVASAVDIPVKTIPHFLSADSFTNVAAPTAPSSRFTCLVIADGNSSFTRKNIDASIQAFTLAFGNRTDVRLVLKLKNLENFGSAAKRLKQQVKETGNIEIIDTVVSDIQMKAIINGSQVLISLHRSEGFGLHLAEAMAAGKPVIATDWSGNTDFMNCENSFPIPYRLIPVQDPHGIYSGNEKSVWAEPEISAAAEALLRLEQDRELARRIGDKARQSIRKFCDGTVLIKALSTETKT